MLPPQRVLLFSLKPSPMYFYGHPSTNKVAFKNHYAVVTKDEFEILKTEKNYKRDYWAVKRKINIDEIRRNALLKNNVKNATLIKNILPDELSKLPNVGDFLLKEQFDEELKKEGRSVMTDDPPRTAFGMGGNTRRKYYEKKEAEKEEVVQESVFDVNDSE
jgi:hypothetical protein